MNIKDSTAYAAYDPYNNLMYHTISNHPEGAKNKISANYGTIKWEYFEKREYKIKQITISVVIEEEEIWT